MSSIASTSQLNKLTVDDKITLINNKDIILDDNAKKVIAVSLPKNSTPAAKDVAKIIDVIPSDFIKKFNASDLATSLVNVSQSKMDNQLTGIITSKVEEVFKY